MFITDMGQMKENVQKLTQIASDADMGSYQNSKACWLHESDGVMLLTPIPVQS